MLIPQVGYILENWVTFVAAKQITQIRADGDITEVVSESSYNANFQPTPSQEIQRMPAEYRGRKLWTVIIQDSEVYFALNDIIEDPEGKRYRIRSSKDWRSAGYTEYVTELENDQ